MKFKCKNCQENFSKGIWLTPQFANEKVLLFCSEKCKQSYIKSKLEHIKIKYPNYYKKILAGKDKEFWGEQNE